MTVATLPYLFSPSRMPSAASFLSGFVAEPATGVLRHPDLEGSLGAAAAAVSVLGSAVHLSRESVRPPVGWRLMACEPRPVGDAGPLFRFEDAHPSSAFGGEAAFESSLGQFVVVSWKQEDEIELRVGWAWEEVTAMQSAIFPIRGGKPKRTAIELSFEGGRMASLRDFLAATEDGMEPLLRRLGERVLASGLIADPRPDDFTYFFEKGEPSPWLPVRADEHHGRFPKNSHVGLFGMALVSVDKALGVEKTEAEKVGLHAGSLDPENPTRLPALLLPLWDLAQSLAMARMPGSKGPAS